MSPSNVSTYFVDSYYELTFALLGLLIVLLLSRGRYRGRKGVANDGNDRAATQKAVHPGIDPSEYADAAEQQAALDRLSQLPQFYHLTGGTLVEWGSGARITACECGLPPFPHQSISWGPDNAQPIVTRRGLAHYLAYHERVAGTHLALLAVRVSRPGGELNTIDLAGAHSVASGPSPATNPDASPLPGEGS